MLQRLGDVELPIGTPWFELSLKRTALGGFAMWPICWQGWTTLAGFFGWIGSIVLLAADAGWLQSPAFF